VDECVTCASTLDVLKLVASADFASGHGTKTRRFGLN
jgi:hypothetical protein